jgi:hypothetical protein
VLPKEKRKKWAKELKIQQHYSPQPKYGISIGAYQSMNG